MSTHLVLPTLMAASGLPVARDLEGRILFDAWHPAALDSEAVTWTDTYETGTRYIPHAEVDPELRDEIEEELRSLGYIQ